MLTLGLIGVVSVVLAAEVPTGTIVDDVKCAADAAQSYALFLPRDYTPDRSWPVIFAFDPGARGRTPVERYQAAATAYGFIVAGSNNSRNASPEIGKAVTAMTSDVMSRFRVDEKRVYVAGMSGGSRVAFSVALGSQGHVAGIIASSAGYPDTKVRKTLPFPVFATAGTEDFNHLEMRRLDRALTSPHRLAIFEGGHVWLSSDLAVEAVEWMELQAMKTGLKPKDADEIERIYRKREAAVRVGATDTSTYLALRGLAEDFEGLKDVRAVAARASELGRDKAVRAALKKDDDEEDREERMVRDVKVAETRLASDQEYSAALAELRRRWKDLSENAQKAEDSPERRLARRVLTGLTNSITSTDPEYLKIVAEYRMARGGR